MTSKIEYFFTIIMEQVICDLQKITLQEILTQEDILTQIKYNEYKITIFEQNDLVYFKAIDIADVLKYTDTRRAIHQHVSEKNKICYKNLLEKYKITTKFKRNAGATMFITKNGLFELLSSTRMTNTRSFIIFVADYCNVDYKIHTRLQKEQEYIGNIILTFNHLQTQTQYKVGKYTLDLYFIDAKLAIECDELGHSNRDADYEQTRETYIKKKLGCKFIRFNPDAKDFCIFTIINQILLALN